MAVQVVYSFLIFLFPLALYCLVLAYVNRSRRPVVVRGAWDCVGLLFALAGFLLWTAPLLLSELMIRVLDVLPVGAEVTLTLSRARWLWLGYYVVVAVGIALMLTTRRHKTIVYNVDTEQFGERLARALAAAGLDCISRSGQLVIAPAEAFTTPAALPASAEFTAAPPRIGLHGGSSAKTLSAMPGGPRYAEVGVDPFAAFCHVTLHWESYTPALRREIEDRLAHELRDGAVPDVNPAAGWFLGFSGMIFGAITLLAAFFVVLFYFGRQR